MVIICKAAIYCKVWAPVGNTECCSCSLVAASFSLQDAPNGVSEKFLKKMGGFLGLYYPMVFTQFFKKYKYCSYFYHVKRNELKIRSSSFSRSVFLDCAKCQFPFLFVLKTPLGNYFRLIILFQSTFL